MKTSFAHAVSENRSLNPDGAPQLLETPAGQDEGIAYGESELPRDVDAYRSNDEVTLALPDRFSRQAHITYGRFVRVKGGRVYSYLPGKYEAPEGEQFQFAANLALPSAQRSGYKASILARITAWSSGNRGCRMARAATHLTAGDPVQLPAIQSS